MQKNKAIFFDRDGVINHPIIINRKPFSPRKLKEFKIYNGFKKFNKLKKKYIFIIVTNQPDLKNNKISERMLNIFHKKINKIVKIDKIYVCPHMQSDNCKCRKPKIGSFLLAKEKYNIDFKKSILIGDRWKDMKAGEKIKCINIFIDRGYTESIDKKIKYKYLCHSIDEAFKKVIDL